MVFLQNVTVSLAHKEAHAHHGASGHYFRNGIKCWQSLCLCLHRATTLTRVAAHRRWHRHWDRTGSGLQRELQAPPGQSVRQQAQAEAILPALYFQTLWGLKTHGSTSVWLFPKFNLRNQNWGRLAVTTPSTTYLQGFHFKHADHDIRKQIFRQQPKHPHTDILNTH